jgi:hypothetical protein
MTATLSAPKALHRLTGATSVFAKYRETAYPYRFATQIVVGTIAGGTPTDPYVAEAWLKKKLGLVSSDDLIRESVAEVMVERGVGAEDAVKEVNEQRNLNGFKRDDRGLYIEGRHVKAMLKEAASVAVSVNKISARGWGSTNKGLRAFFAEHVFVAPEDEVYLYLADDEGNLAHVTQPTGVMQRFVSTFRGTGIQYEEYVKKAVIPFTVRSKWCSGRRSGSILRRGSPSSR